MYHRYLTNVWYIASTIFPKKLLMLSICRQTLPPSSLKPWQQLKCSVLMVFPLAHPTGPKDILYIKGYACSNRDFIRDTSNWTFFILHHEMVSWKCRLVEEILHWWVCTLNKVIVLFCLFYVICGLSQKLFGYENLGEQAGMAVLTITPTGSLGYICFLY